MTLARFETWALDQAGNIMPGASVEVRRESDNGLESLYTDRNGTVSAGNPVYADGNGFVGFHVTDGVYKITATSGGNQTIRRYVGISLFSEMSTDPGTVRGNIGLTSLDLSPLLVMFPASPVKNIWRSDDLTSSSTPRTYTVSAVAGTLVTITTSDVASFFHSSMRDSMMVRIWNTSKSPAEPAWVNWDNASDQFSVHDAADVASWTTGDTLRLGDPNPTGTNNLDMVAIDISNYLLNNYGLIFPQAGLNFYVQSIGVGGRIGMGFSGTGSAGSAYDGFSNDDGSAQGCFINVFTPILSPISNSNLIFLRETIFAPATAMGSGRLARLSGMWV